MDELTLLPFSQKEMEEQYTFHTFTERNVEFCLLRNSKHSKPQSGNLYKFGLADENWMYWFFNGKAVIKGRLDALKTFSALKKYCKSKDIGEPFAYKVYK
jgi:hypothetical protein